MMIELDDNVHNAIIIRVWQIAREFWTSRERQPQAEREHRQPAEGRAELFDPNLQFQFMNSVLLLLHGEFQP